MADTTAARLLRHLAKRHGLRQHEVARLLRESPRTVQDWMQGRREPSMGLLTLAIEAVEIQLAEARRKGS